MTAPFKDFLCDYQHGGRELTVIIRASSEDDAWAQLRAIRTTGQIKGTEHMRIPVYPGVGLFVRAYTWLRNVTR